MFNDKYRIVLTCYDSNTDVPPFLDSYNRLLANAEAGEVALALADKECRGLMNGFDGEGSFRVSEGSSDSYVAVNWFHFKEAETEENLCVIEPVTEYNIYLVRFYGTDENASCSYRGFDVVIDNNLNCYSIQQNNVQVAVVHSLNKALDWVDDYIFSVELSKLQEIKRRNSIDVVISGAIERSAETVKNIPVKGVIVKEYGL